MFKLFEHDEAFWFGFEAFWFELKLIKIIIVLYILLSLAHESLYRILILTV